MLPFNISKRTFFFRICWILFYWNVDMTMLLQKKTAQTINLAKISPFLLEGWTWTKLNEILFTSSVASIDINHLRLFWEVNHYMDDFPPNIPMMINELDRKNILTVFFLYVFVLENVHNTESKKWKWKELTNNKWFLCKISTKSFSSHRTRKKNTANFFSLYLVT